MEVFIVMPFWKCDPPSINDHHNVVDVVENFVSVTTECKCDQAKGNVMNLPNFYNIFELPKIVICRMVAKVHPMMILDERRFIAGDLIDYGEVRLGGDSDFDAMFDYDGKGGSDVGEVGKLRWEIIADVEVDKLHRALKNNYIKFYILKDPYLVFNNSNKYKK